MRVKPAPVVSQALVEPLMDMPMSPEIGPAQEIGQCLLARAPEHHRNGGAGCSVPRRDPKGCHTCVLAARTPGRPSLVLRDVVLWITGPL
jgi:hypothetical protein